MNNQKLLTFINSQKRNKIVIHEDSLPGLHSIDLGKKLAYVLKPIVNHKRLPLKCLSLIVSILSTSIEEDKLYGKYLAIQNLGILLEPDLKLDLAYLLDNFSTSNTLFVEWEGEIEGDNLYFQTKHKGKKIDISHLSHIVI